LYIATGVKEINERKRLNDEIAAIISNVTQHYGQTEK
jgi:hypothetical protein